MFILESGSVEICVSAGGQVNHVRLAAFAEGSIFGELSLLTNEPRTANANCSGQSCEISVCTSHAG